MYVRPSTLKTKFLPTSKRLAISQYYPPEIPAKKPQVKFGDLPFLALYSMFTQILVPKKINFVQITL